MHKVRCRVTCVYKAQADGMLGIRIFSLWKPESRCARTALASLESGGALGLVGSATNTTAMMIQSLGLNSHIISINDIHGGTFRYMTRVATENQGLETTFVSL